MIVEATCKVCQRSLHLTGDDEYAALGDPHKLYRMAACNRCGDFMSDRNVIFRKVGRKCRMLAQRILKGDELDKAKELLRHDLKSLMRLHADHRNAQIPDWDEAILESILSKPSEFGNVLGRLPALFSQEAML